MRLAGIWAFLLVFVLSCGRGAPAPQAPPVPPELADVRRLLTQATFGVTDAGVAAVADAGLSGWLDAQFALPLGTTCVQYLDERKVQLAADPRALTLGADQFYECFYARAATAPDQLRQRMAFALSQIFVISMRNEQFFHHIRSAGSYYDMLTADAFGNYRTLLEDVTLHPAMGMYLTYFYNQPDDPTTGRVPDENYAREILQLMSIGLCKLNPDGSPRLDGQGRAIPTYSHDDVAGLAKVFTGFSWYSPAATDTAFWTGASPESEIRPMTLYPQWHSNSAKAFLGTTLAPAAAADPAGDLEAALDAIFNHPNVGPFFGRRLIQQLVTSNPSPAYVGRVAAAFDDDGRGVRGDLKAVIRAVLLDPEARDLAGAQAPGFGKLREPVLRFTQWMRAFGAQSRSGAFLLGNTDDTGSALGQSPLNAPSVFNFWQPGYQPALGPFSGTGMEAPEFVGVDEVSVAGYINFMQAVVDQGCGGGSATSPATPGPDIQSTYAQEVPLAGDPEALVARLEQTLLCGTLSPELRSALTEAVASVPLPADGDSARLASARLDRVKLAVFLVLASPEFLHQR